MARDEKSRQKALMKKKRKDKQRSLKNTFCNADILEVEHERFKDRIHQESSLINAHPRLAHRIIYGAIEYAKDIGFEPHKDFKLSRFVLDEPTEVDLSCQAEFGKDGKPFYIAGPDDNADYISNELSKRIGEGNFHFTYPI